MHALTRLTTHELIEGTQDLLSTRTDALLLLSSGDSFRTLLTRVTDDLGALPSRLRGMPDAELLGDLDDEHDSIVSAIELFRGAIERWPGATAEMRAAARALATDILPGKGGTLQPYGVEARVAARAEDKVAAHADTLAAVPTPDGTNLLAWTQRYVEKGKALGTALSGRADAMADRSSPGEAAGLRGRLIGVFFDLRTAIRRDLEARPELPRTLESDVLGYLDELQRLADARRRATPTRPEPEAPQA